MDRQVSAILTWVALTIGLLGFWCGVTALILMSCR